MSTDRLTLDRFYKRVEPEEQARIWLEASRVAILQGDVGDARRLVSAAVQADPHCVEAWLVLARLEKDVRKREDILKQVVKLQPDNSQAMVELVHLQRLSKPEAPAKDTGNQQSLRLVLALLILAASLVLLATLLWGPVDTSLAWLLPTATPTMTPTPTLTPRELAAQFEPQLESALSSQNYDRALEIVAIMQGVDAGGQEVLQWALSTHMQYGQALVADARHVEALEQFSQAIALAPSDDQALLWQQTTQTYLAGQDALRIGKWDVAVESFEKVQSQMAGYNDVSTQLLTAYRFKGQAALEAGEWSVAVDALTIVHDAQQGDEYVADLLSQAYRQRGIVFQEERKLQEARADLEAALALRPDDGEAQSHLDEVMYELFPPKRIEINISTQRFYAYEGDTLVYKFVTSTGLRGRDTAAGHYKVLSKIPMAYSSIWRLKMPYWLGIYYVGRIENGIHALPIRPDGSVMWGGLLGQRASYGCVILTTEAAKTIYNWAEIGTPVHIHY